MGSLYLGFKKKPQLIWQLEFPLKVNHNPYSYCISDNYFSITYLPYIEAEDKLAQWHRDDILITESHSELYIVHRLGNNFGSGKHLK